MNFLRNLFGSKRSGQAARRSGDMDSLEKSYRDTIGSIVDENDSLRRPEGGETAAVSDILTNINSKVNTGTEEGGTAVAAKPEAPAVNIWDMEDDGGSTALPETAPETPKAAATAASRSPARSRRTKTRLIGFEKSDGDVVDLFNDSPKAAPAQRAKFPVGWVVVTEGPGRGECFTLLSGMSQIGRGEDQAVQLDFGDNSISRTNHAAIVFDPENKEFLLGHGGKSNIVRLNDKPLISNEALKTGDVISIGETVLRFVALCDKTFNWKDGASGEDEDVAIA